MPKDELLKLYYKYRFIIYPVLVAAAGIFLVVVVIIPQTVTFIKNQQAIKEYAQRHDSLKAKAVELEGLDKNELKKRTDVALSVLPEDKDYSGVLGLVQSTAARDGFSVLSFQIGAPFINSSTKSSGFNVKIEFLGPKDNLKLLLANIEDSSQVLRLSGIEVNNLRRADMAEGILTVDAYYAPIPSTIGSVDAPLLRLSEQDFQTLLKYTRLAASVPVSTTSATPSQRGKSNPFE